MTLDGNSLRTLLAAICGSAALMMGSVAPAAVPVEESRASSSREASAEPRLPAGRGNGGNDGDGGAVDTRSMSGNNGDADAGRLSQLFYQLQVLQQEVQELRGLVEEQQYRLDRLARDQQEQYLDLDRRMQALRGDGQRPLVIPDEGDSGAGGRGSPAGSASSSGAAASDGGSASEREAYSAAFELMRQRQFEESEAAFETLTDEYPNGVYTANAFYWLGELNLALDDTEQAREWFAQVVNVYPDHQKIPDTLYKLGVTYHRLGDEDRAREYLNRVRDEHPQSSAAGLAQNYLAEL